MQRLPILMICRGFALVLIGSVLLGIAGCSTIQFKHDWRRASRSGCCGEDLEGLWEGNWVSRATGHTGTVQAIITKQSENCYYARFHSTFKVVIPFDYDVPLYVTRTGDVYQFEGRADLGRLAGGLYTARGDADDCCLQASYCAEKDHGTFCLRRVSTAVPCCR